MAAPADPIASVFDQLGSDGIAALVTAMAARATAAPAAPVQREQPAYPKKAIA